MNIYYVYFYLRDDFTPYYVGKGKLNRCFTKNKNEKIKSPKDKNKILIVKQNLSELQSLILERYYIRWFGRKDNNTGILRNLTDGGEGASGRKLTEEQKYKCGNATRGKIAWNKGRKQPHKTHKSRSLGKIYKERKDKKIPKQKYKCLYCDTYMDIGNLNRYHNNNCINNITPKA